MGNKYSKVFRGLRLHHIINDGASTKVIEQDRIIPHSMYALFITLLHNKQYQRDLTLCVGPSLSNRIKGHISLSPICILDV